jgi:hypothetical protein
MSPNGNSIPPLPIQKQLRKETNFGCALCGCPILEFAHIIPYGNKVQAYLPENMIALCPNHHTKFNRGELSESYLRDAKKNPHNRIQVKDAFFIESQDIAVNLGKSKFINTSRILVVDDFDIISINIESEKYVLLNINFFDKLNNLVAVVAENSWSADKSLVWNIEYKPQDLIIRNALRNISFEVKIENGEEIFLTGGMYFNGYPIRITENEVLLGDKEIGLELKGSVLKNYDVGISAQTGY